MLKTLAAREHRSVEQIRQLANRGFRLVATYAIRHCAEYLPLVAEHCRHEGVPVAEATRRAVASAARWHAHDTKARLKKWQMQHGPLRADPVAVANTERRLADLGYTDPHGTLIRWGFLP